MTQFAASLLARIQMLEVHLQCCRARLQDSTDVEALHDLRINLRTLRSLLRPLRELPSIDLLEQSAADLGRLTNPIRELQVLVAELEQAGLSDVAAQYREGLEPAFQQLLASAELPRLFEVLDAFPQIWRLSAREGCLRGLRRRVRRQFRHDLRHLPRHPDSSDADLHSLRLKVKRLRYCSQVYPELSPLGPRQLKMLRKMQQLLGDWNDCQYWLLCTAQDQRLTELRKGWLTRGHDSANQAEALLKRFRNTGS
jgi:CHAD domain-containing protein